ncbi:lysosomal Pro-X carboxypeptidase-like [Chelonus insularis]|uniref:lysosomal Pro-X carboxypeptidase-like n=1 Tax=Chelonus insularis TaxID=460826 RepID=UPI00158CC7F2|nr:lysosomal Pro-X carboxypeptidase-like [Chelonus insularis]
MNILKFLIFNLLIIFQCAIEACSIELENNTDEEIVIDGLKYNYVIRKFKVPINHFSFVDDRKFEIRYLVNNTWQKEINAPIFFHLGNEGKIEIFAKISGFLWDIAPIFGALIIFAEHRYYGESLPFGNKTFSSVKNLEYLNTQQALLDYVNLIEFLRTDNKLKHSPVIVFGGSYAGQLAAWMRLKYPHIVQGAIAASAPILQFSNITDCHLFTRIVTSDFRNTNPICSKAIRQSWDAITNLTSTASGKRWLFIMWNLCKPLRSKSDVQKLKDWLSNIYITLAMANYPYPIDFPAPLPAFSIKHFCKHFTKNDLPHEKLLMILKKGIDVYANFTGQNPCIDIESGIPELGTIGWDYQTCTELVMPICSDGINDMFEPQSWNLKEIAEYCKKNYKVVPNDQIICKQYGCTDFETATNIVFSNGLMDPWSAGGVLKDLTRSAIAVVIPNAAHGLDLRGANSADPHGVIRARDIHRNLIKKWINDYDELVNQKYESN